MVKSLGTLIIFTRYPQPGLAKTRLIPQLGTVGAAHLSRQMTEYTLGHVRTLQQHFPIAVEIWFAGGTLSTMQHWLGDEWSYMAQVGDDLGDRMVRSLQAAFQAGAQRVVIIGTDCPEITPHLLAHAFQALTTHDLVLGPAQDGGYYLIGLRRLVPELFQDIAWSTADVLSQTVRIAHQLNLAIAHLPTLRDIDQPEDLALWSQIIQDTNHEHSH